MHVDVNENGPTVHDATDLKRLAVVCADRVHLSTIGALGRVADDGEHVWLKIDALRIAAAATLPADERDEWVHGFDGMIDYATSKGWVEGDAVRAHVESPAQ